MGIERMPRARIDVGGEVAVSGGELPYVIANEGDVPLLFGAGYGFEEGTAEGWRPVHIRQAFAAWGAQIAPGISSRELSARVPRDLSSGRYRLITSLIVLQMNGAPVRGPSGPVTLTVSHEFMVEESAGAGA
jgi:hypothetical protein